MKSTVYIDDQGRIKLSEGLLKESGLQPNDSLELLINNNNILLKINRKACVICGSREEIKEYRGKAVCCKCIRSMLNYN